MNVDIERTPGADCQAFVSGRSDGTIAHLPAWHEMVMRATGYEGLYLVARDTGAVRGVLPMVHVRSRLFGNHMVSQGFSNYGGPLADSGEALKALYECAVALAGSRGCESIEFRNIKPLPYDLPAQTDKVCMYLPLSADPETLWDSFNAKVRNQVRKAEKSGLEALCGGMELLEEFYRVYAIRMHQLGTPSYSHDTFRYMLELMPKEFRIFVVRQGELTMGVGITCCFNGLAEIPFASTLVQYNNLCPNNLLYWSVMKHYCQTGAEVFDFGRSSIDAGTYQFKKQWGAQPVQLHYQYWVASGREFSLVSPDNPKYRWKVEIWKKLPLRLANWLGPRISRGLP